MKEGSGKGFEVPRVQPAVAHQTLCVSRLVSNVNRAVKVPSDFFLKEPPAYFDNARVTYVF
jgi:hypothetical protein